MKVPPITMNSTLSTLWPSCFSCKINDRELLLGATINTNWRKFNALPVQPSGVFVNMGCIYNINSFSKFFFKNSSIYKSKPGSDGTHGGWLITSVRLSRIFKIWIRSSRTVNAYVSSHIDVRASMRLTHNSNNSNLKQQKN